MPPLSDINMQAIAELAGVSRTTVSRVLRSPERVHPDTLRRIQDLMSRQGYVYHAAAADLPRRKTSVIGLILPTLRTPVFAETLLAVQNAATELGMTVMLGGSQYDPLMEEHLLRQYQARRLAGIILAGPTPGGEERIRDVQKSGIPCVIIWNCAEAPDLNQVGFDNKRAAHEATRHLIDLGHRRIAIVTGPLTAGRRVRDRLAGFEQAMAESGLAVDPALIRAREPELAAGEEEMRSLMTLPEPPTAVFAASDILAVGALSAARALGLAVPRDVSVMGFDDIEFAAHTNPPLTTVRVPAGDMSRIAALFLRELMHAPAGDMPRSCCLFTKLIVRESCAPPGGMRAHSF